MSIHNVGDKFNIEKLKEAQLLTKSVVRKVSERCFPGMTEIDGINLIDEEFKKIGELKFWHPHKFRIGKNTLCAFKDESDLSIKLEANGHFFIDVGPIIEGHEGDYGETFFLGLNPEAKSLSENSKELFTKASEKFLNENISGKALYDYLNTEAKNISLKLNMKSLGHRIGDFPHHLYYRGKMADVTEELQSNLWVLEVQISNKAETMGAFYEDILWK